MMEVAFTCWTSTHGKCEIKLTQTAAKDVPGIHLYRVAMLSQAGAPFSTLLKAFSPCW